MKIINSYLIVSIFLLVMVNSSVSVLAAQEASSIMCDEGVVQIGDLDVDVRSKCGNPEGGDTNEWVYDFGPGQPSYTVIFDEGKVVRILEND